MFQQDTTFVIGAGASTEFGKGAFPVGGQLRQMIQNGYTFRGHIQAGDISHGDQRLFHALQSRYRHSTREFEGRLNAAELISKHLYMFPSIDAFIDHYDDGENHVAELGKLAIGAFIARAERKSQVFHGQTTNGQARDLSVLRGSWIEPFTRIAMDRVKDPEQLTEGVSVICFNYDRCIERYLIEAISSRYRLSYRQARSIVSRMNIIHPYGTLGPLPETEQGQDATHPEFGLNVDDRFDPFRLIGGIKTYTERVEEASTLDRIHSAIADSRQLVFLGFGFTTENMTLLSEVARFV